VEADDRVQEPVDGEPAGLEVDAEEAGEEQVGLPGLDGDGGRDAAGIQIPAVGADGVRGDDPAACQRLRLALDECDLIDELERAVRESDAGRERVHLGEQRPEHVADLPHGERAALLVGQNPRDRAA